MKKFFRTMLVLMLAFVSVFAFASCKKDDMQEIDANVSVKFYVPDGTPALAIGKLLANNTQYSCFTTTYNVVQASLISTVFSAYQADLAIMPTISAAALYKQGAKIKLISTNVFGNLYVVGVNTEANSFDDLYGKIVYTTTGTTIALAEYLIGSDYYVEANEAQTGKIALSSKTDGSEIIPLLKQAQNSGTEAYAILGEPQVTKCKSVVSSTKICINLQTEWTTKTGFEKYPQASLIATKAFCDVNGDYITSLLNDLGTNSQYLNENYSTIPTVMGDYNSSLANMTFTAETIANCNFDLKKASDIKESVIQYCSALKNITLDDAFFY